MVGTDGLRLWIDVPRNKMCDLSVVMAAERGLLSNDAIAYS